MKNTVKNDCALSRNNCLSTIRIFAAFQVMFGHLIRHLKLSCPTWLSGVVGYFSGVSIFFAISGFLIWSSIERSNSYGDYLKKRFFRIYPELWVGVLIEIISIIILYRGWEIKSLIAFAFTQGTVLQFWTPDSLRDYGCGTPNGTLWTICATVQFYLIAWFLHKLMHKKKFVLWLAGYIILVFTSVLGHKLAGIIGPDIIVKLFDQTIFRYLWLFYIGCFIAEFKDNILPIISKYWFAFISVGVIPILIRKDIYAGYNVVIAMSLATGLIGFSYRFPRIAIKTDISYGLFIYHMVIVNIFISLGLTGNWWQFLAVLVISCICAYISTITIGKWAAIKKIKK